MAPLLRRFVRTPRGGGGGGGGAVSSVNSRTGTVTGLAEASDVTTGLAGKQAASSDLAAIAGLTLSNDDVLQRKAGGWVRRTVAQLATDLGTYLVSMAGGNVISLSASSVQFASVDIPDDGSATSGWPDRLAFFHTPSGGTRTRTGYHNEYGELRARPAKSSTVALRALGHATAGGADVFQVADTSQATVYFRVSSTAAAATVPLTVTGTITASGAVTGSNIGVKVSTGTTAPTGPATGDVWVDTN